MNQRGGNKYTKYLKMNESESLFKKGKLIKITKITRVIVIIYRY